PLRGKGLDEAVPLLVGKRGVEHAADRRIEHLPVGPDFLERLAEPRGPDELAALLLLEEHVPAVDEVERVGEIDPPVDAEGHLPAKRDDLADLAALEGRRVPKPHALEERDPDLPALRAVLDLRAREGARVALTRDREHDVLRAVLEDRHHDRITLSREVEE